MLTLLLDFLINQIRIINDYMRFPVTGKMLSSAAMGALTMIIRSWRFVVIKSVISRVAIFAPNNVNIGTNRNSVYPQTNGLINTKMKNNKAGDCVLIRSKKSKGAALKKHYR